MDVLFDNDLDNNNNVIPLLNNNDHNQINLNVPFANVDENNMNNNMENNVPPNDAEDADIHVLNNAHFIANNIENYQNEIPTNNGSNIENQNEITSNENNTNDTIRNPSENEQNIASSFSSLNARKSKKRKRHYNLNKNKKWNKSFKRQKSTNTTKSEAENVLQCNRNKHLYAKVPKIIFNNKQVMHRGGGVSKFFLPDKRPRKDMIVPPTKFLLGGNISDPLNLNSLQDEALVSMSAVTPKSSPITTPPKVEVIIPPNIYDPLHLLDPVDSVEYEKQLVSPLKARRLNKQRSRKKKIKKYGTDILQIVKKNESEDVCALDSAQITASPQIIDIPTVCLENIVHSGYEVPSNSTFNDEKCKLESNTGSATTRKRKFSETGGMSSFIAIGNGSTIKKLRRFDSKDKIVSPVIPQPGAWKRPPKVLLGAPRNRIRTTSTSDVDNADENTTKKNELPLFEESKQDEIHISSTKNTPERSTQSYVSTLKSTTNNATMSQATGSMSITPESAKYQYGNYAGPYCGLQNLINLSDVRLTVFLRHAYLFKDKDILDIGCNVGHMTIAVARKLNPNSIIGVDIDKNLIARARRNLSIFQRMSENELRNLKGSYKIKYGMQLRARDRERCDLSQIDFFPLTFPICFGGLPNVKQKVESPSASPASSTQNIRITEQFGVGSFTKLPNNEIESSNKTQNDTIANRAQFPSNVFFRTLNYAVTEESQMVSDRQQYDLILCLSLTKWIHLNFGDAGLKMTFRRMFNQLRPGGKLILEAQNWASYKKRKKLTPTIYNNYKNIEFFPNNFHEYLLSPEVGFSHSYTLGVPRHTSKGFYRPIQL
ncbi:probable RNA methyltransferase bin3 isoform X2 [Contarinia nasturtii]|nr:probable RNA methyltransferase bin3 isoform X2 [Contarinia nasturtii]